MSDRGHPPSPSPLDPVRLDALSERAGSRSAVVYVLMVEVGAAAFLWPFFVPAAVLPPDHGIDAPLIGAAVGMLVVVAVLLELRSGDTNGATIALLGVLAAVAGLLRLLDLPGGGSGVYFLVVLAGVAFGPRFGVLLGLAAMIVSAVVTGGIGPWLPFQMLALSWLGGGAGLLGRATRRLRPGVEVAVVAAYGWAWGFLYGAIMNLWFWPFVRDGGALSYVAGLPAGETLTRYLGFYTLTSLGWDATAALANATLIAVTAHPLLASMRRVSGRLAPVVELAPPAVADH